MAKKGIVKRYTDAKGKKSFGVSAMKTGIETVGALAGSGVGAASGIASPFLGIGLLFLGQIMGDQTGLLKVAGAGMIGYGIASRSLQKNFSLGQHLNLAS